MDRMAASGLLPETSIVPAPASGQAGETGGRGVAAPPLELDAEPRASAASGVRGRKTHRTRAERSDQRPKREAERSESPASDGSRGRRSVTSAASGRNVVKHDKFVLTDRAHLKCKFCNTCCTDDSVTAVYDLPMYEGKTPWRSYKHFHSEQNEDGSLTVFRRPEGKVCMLCKSVYAELGWQDTYGTLDAYSKNGRTDDTHARFMQARKLLIKKRLDLAASGQPMQESPSGRTKRARVSGRNELREASAKITSFSGSTNRFHAPKRAFVLLEHWDEELDGKYDPTKVVTKHIKGLGDQKGIWRSHGRPGVFLEDNFDDCGYRESHIEADNEGPLGTERME